MNNESNLNFARPLRCVLYAFIALGVLFRFYQINQSDFYFFDAGMYLNYGRILLDSCSIDFTKSFPEILESISRWYKVGFQTDRPLWQLMVDSRVLWGGTEAWSYIRLLSAIMGSFTLVLVYMLARKLYDSKPVALLSSAFLAVLPSHLFYSRLGLPEAATTFFFILGLYFYIGHRQLGMRTFLAGFFLACSFFTNYRFVILPFILLAAEFVLSLAQARRPDWKKLMAAVGTFMALVAGACMINNGSYFTVTTGWLFHQADLAGTYFSFTNLLTYPYILFRFETWPFAILLCGSFYFLYKREWLKALPFVIVCLQMGIFSFSADKASRYVCAVTPLMALSAALFVMMIMDRYKSHVLNVVLFAFCLLTAGFFFTKTVPMISNHSAHRPVMEYLTNVDPNIKIVSTQPLVLNLYTNQRNNVIPCPGIKDPAFLGLPEAGYRYLVVGPQAYVSWTADGVSFSGDLGGILNFFDKRVPPVKKFKHLNDVMLERFVFEHNQNLLRSIEFLNSVSRDAKDIRVFDIPEGLALMKEALAARGVKK